MQKPTKNKIRELLQARRHSQPSHRRIIDAALLDLLGSEIKNLHTKLAVIPSPNKKTTNPISIEILSQQIHALLIPYNRYKRIRELIQKDMGSLPGASRRNPLN